MAGELFTAALKELWKKGTEVICEAGDIAELGAIKPPAYGTLIRQKYRIDTAADGTLPQVRREASIFDKAGIEHFFQKSRLDNPQNAGNNRWLSLRPQEVAREAAAYLCDYNIVPERWNMAETGEKTEMLSDAVKLMGKEMQLPGKWLEEIEPLIEYIPPEDNGTVTMAYASYWSRPLSNGGIEVIGVPELVINTSTLELDYYKVMSTVYHEMIHIRQYASIDGVAPSEESDIRLLDLISDMKKEQSGRSRVEYLSSPYEAEAWAQGLFFEEMLKAVIRESAA